MPCYDGIIDNLNTHWSLDVCRLVAQWCKVPFEPDKLKKGGQRRAFLSDPSHHHVLHFTPKHGSWLNQAELFFGTLQRRFLARGSLRSIKDFERRLVLQRDFTPVDEVVTDVVFDARDTPHNYALGGIAKPPKPSRGRILVWVRPPSTTNEPGEQSNRARFF
jgi:transposase